MKKAISILSRCVFAALCFCLAQAAGAQARQLPNLFYAMDTGTDSTRLSAGEQVAMVKDLGFAGIDIVYRDLPKVQDMIAAVDKYKIRLFSIYVPVFIEKGKEPDLNLFGPLCAALQGRNVTLLTALNSRSYKPSSREGDPQAVETLRKLSAMARANGLRVAVYPHYSSWVERVDHAVSLVKEVHRKNVGVVFNLCHWLKTDGSQLETRISEAMPCLFAVTICGACRDGGKRADWSRLIMPLDQGDYDVTAFLAEFIKRGYKGPIGLQHYGIKGDAKENLAHSMAGWKKISAAVAAKSVE